MNYNKRECDLLNELAELADTRLKGDITNGYTYLRNDGDTIRMMCVNYPLTICNVIFNDPATIVFWADGTKTVVKCQEGDWFDPEKGLAMAISKKVLGNKSNFNNTFKKWMPQCEEIEMDVTCLYKNDDNKDAFEQLKNTFEKLFS